MGKELLPSGLPVPLSIYLIASPSGQNAAIYQVKEAFSALDNTATSPHCQMPLALFLTHSGVTARWSRCYKCIALHLRAPAYLTSEMETLMLAQFGKECSLLLIRDAASSNGGGTTHNLNASRSKTSPFLFSCRTMDVDSNPVGFSRCRPSIRHSTGLNARHRIARA